MAQPYRDQFREKVVQAIDQGMTKSKASRTFGISRNTIHNWLKLREKTGSCSPRQHYQKGSNPKITDWEKFEAFLEQNRGKTEEEMAAAWEEPISRHTIRRAIKKLEHMKKFRH
jgi:transposase